MTPTQLRAYTTMARLGSIKLAAEELGVSESAVSFNIAQLRKELGDQLVTRHASGLAFTPGGLRLVSRGIELLGLQERTVAEVGRAASGRGMLRVAASSLFGEYSAPGLIELFSDRVPDLDIELSLHRPDRFAELLQTRVADVAIGARPERLPHNVASTPFLKYGLVVVAAPDHPLAHQTPSPHALRTQEWYLGPAAATHVGLVPAVLRNLRIPAPQLRIFQSHTAATEEAKRGGGLTLALSFAVSKDIAAGSLVRVDVPGLGATGTWVALRCTDGEHGSLAAELTRFVTTPRAMQAMIKGTGVTVGHFRPAIHVTLWS